MSQPRLDLYQQMYLVRSAERTIQQHYLEDEMKTPMHMSIGQEAIVCGVCAAIGEDAQVLGTYRSHALYLIKTDDVDGFMGEMCGRTTGAVGGRGGSMHLLNPEKGVIGTSAIVGSCLPVAAGAAFANRCRGTNQIVAVFFGDGAIDEGVFWETLNVACLMKLPLLFVCEDNDLAVHVTAAQRHGYKDIASVVAQMNCHVAASDSIDPEEIREIAAHAVRQIRETSRPAFLHLKYFRFLEHVGVFEDFKAGYRAHPDEQMLRRMDPVLRYRGKLLEAISENRVVSAEAAIDQRVQRSFEAARHAPLPSTDTVLACV